jgi:hypothetical protein
VFNAGDDQDRVYGFSSSKDKIDLSSYGLSGFDDIEHAIHHGLLGTTIELGGGDSIFLAGPLGVHVDEDNFIF